MARLIFEWSINLIETFVAVYFVTNYLGAKYNGTKKIFGFCAGWLILFVALCIMNYITVFETYGTYFFILLCFLYCLFFLNGGACLKLWVCLLSHLITLGVSYATNLIYCYIVGYSPFDLISIFNEQRITMVLIVRVIHFILVKLALKTKYTNPINNRNGFALCLIPATSILALAFMMKVILMNEEISLYMVVGMLSLIIADVVTYYLFIVLNKEYEKNTKSKLLEQQNENLQRSIADDKAFVQKMKTLRHDINNHNIAIKALFESGDCRAGIEYMNNIGQQLDLTNDIIETGNIALDAIINAKKTIAQSKGIDFIRNIQIPEKVFVNETDLCTIFGNALDNCIEACEKIKDRDRKISVSIVFDDDSLICKIANTSINADNELLNTTKQNKENHGFGISNIKTALSKYNNVCRFKQTDTEFILSFVIFNK